MPNRENTAKLTADSTQALGPKGLEALKLTAATPISAVTYTAGPGIGAELKKIKNANAGKELKTAFGRYGAQLSAIRTWVKDADEMEAEAEATAATGKPEPKPTISGIVIKQGSTEVAVAAKGEYDRGTRILAIAQVTWKPAMKDPLSLLQKKVTVLGKYPADEGKFAVDMKVEGLKLGGALRLKAV